MKRLTLILVGFLLAGCSNTWETSYEAPVAAEVSRGWAVRGVVVNVPEALTTTENNSFAPNADIVWHGEPFGDRKAQAAAIVKQGISEGAQGLRGSRPVVLNVTLDEFHAVTPKARARAPSAVHNVSYVIQVNDARSGAVLTEPALIRADLSAYVGSAATEATFQGQTQKVRITQHIRAVTAGWLGIGPDARRTFSSAGR